MRAVRTAAALALLVASASASLATPPRRHVPLEHKGALRSGGGSGYPACDPSVTQRSGYFDINATTNKHYFYWMFEAKQNPSTAPVLLWMTGGPGCSSGLAMLAENGPCHINEETGDLYSNPYSWNNVANVIYIDQPAGVGFSYGDFPQAFDRNETMVANDMYAFVQAFLAGYPQYQSNPFFVYGESYGGHYAPATAHRIWQGNNANEGVQVNLQGLSTGNGMTRPETQFKYYANLSYQWCDVVRGAPCINTSTYNTQEAAVPQCIQYIEQCNAAPSDENQGCLDAYNYCMSTQMTPFQSVVPPINVYDIRKPCVGMLCYNFSAVTEFFNRPDVQQSLGVASQDITWVDCNMTVNAKFTDDWMRNFDYCVKDLLNAGIRVLVYAGDMDWICNWLGNKAWTLELDWNQKTAFNAAQDYPWWVNEEPAGRVRTVSGANNNLLFTFLQIHEAGHMVPMDQPQRALNMVNHFLFDQSFDQFDGPV